MVLLGLTRTATVAQCLSASTKSHFVFPQGGGGERHSALLENSSDLKQSRKSKTGTLALSLVWSHVRALIMRTQSFLVKTMFIVKDHHLASLSLNGPPESSKKFRSES